MFFIHRYINCCTTQLSESPDSALCTPVLHPTSSLSIPMFCYQPHLAFISLAQSCLASYLATVACLASLSSKKVKTQQSKKLTVNSKKPRLTVSPPSSPPCNFPPFPTPLSLSLSISLLSTQHPCEFYISSCHHHHHHRMYCIPIPGTNYSLQVTGNRYISPLSYLHYSMHKSARKHSSTVSNKTDACVYIHKVLYYTFIP